MQSGQVLGRNGANMRRPRAEKGLFGKRWLETFGLDPTVLHVNHGSFGAVPEPVRNRQRSIQDEVRADPSRFFRSEYRGRLRKAAGSVAEFLGGAPEDWVFVENATSAANSVISSLRLESGDTILFTNQAYGAVRKAVLYWCDRTGAKPVEAPVSPPVSDPEQVTAAVVSAMRGRTRLVVLDHVASACGIVFPIFELCRHFRERDIPVLVDGAHAPGNLDLDVPSIGADFYIANAHKWLCAPLGSGVLWCRRSRQERMRPTAISHGYGSGFSRAFDWTGTRDPSAWLSVPAAIEFHNSVGGGLLRRRNRAVANKAAQRLASQFGTELSAPEDMHCSMASVRLAEHGYATELDTERLQLLVAASESVSVSLARLGGSLWLRLSAAIYNEIDDLVEAGHRVSRVLGELHGRR
ncbi:MAG: aminotransferase class V-fold PLP-dependent enzyme [Albidovulum sp.]|nr:aminotransferase class V-fold PLP-dependent enzyme [Albidovulum sp.]